MLTSAHDSRRIDDEVVGRGERVTGDLLDDEQHQALQQGSDQPAETCALGLVGGRRQQRDPVNAGRSTTWSRWA